MIKEEYVSFEVAKLLKEKGFDEYCPKSYFKMDKTLKESGFSEWEKVNEIKAPTQSLAMKWLREVHNIHIVIHPYTDMEGHNWSFILDKFAYGCWQELGIYITDSWNTYEEACEAAVLYCLKHLI